MEAALRYYELSQTEPGRGLGNGKVYGEADLTAALTNAVTCAILASAGRAGGCWFFCNQAHPSPTVPCCFFKASLLAIYANYRVKAEV